jgi:hypothetical protein
MISPLACDLNAIVPENRAAHQALGERLIAELVQEVRELPDGYPFRFSPGDYIDITAYVVNERLCFPFFAFDIEVGTKRGPVWLRITGRAGVKEFLRSEMKG